jgi:rare lipoprotein A
VFGGASGGGLIAAGAGLAAVLAGAASAAPSAAPSAATLPPARSADLSVGDQLASSAHPTPVAVSRVLATAASRPRAAALAHRPAAPAHGASFSGLASWYGPGFEGHVTASGQPYSENAMTAASRTLPLGTHLQVCHDGACVVVLINDWGPVPTSRILDLSRAAAIRIGLVAAGVGEVTATPV